jgi:glycosyltransferase involved in cell wall biosynthesis
MNKGISVKHRPLRVLLLGPAFTANEAGGLHLALRDVVNQLNKRGWQVDDQIWTTLNLESQSATKKIQLQSTRSYSLLSSFQRHTWLLKIWMSILPIPARRFFSILLMPRVYFESISHNLYAAEKMLEQAQKYDLVLLCVDGAPPGMSAFVTAKFERVVFIDLFDLVNELGSTWRWTLNRQVARWHLGKQVHPYLFRPISPAKIPPTIFASAEWRKEAIRAGVPEAQAYTIYFGVPQPEPLLRSDQIPNRLLWVGRLSPEKGLHLLLQVMPAIRQKIANATLTIVASQGPSGYRQLIMAIIKKHRLEEVVTFLPAVERGSLPTLYAEHAVLFFHSIFTEPVALVLMEAFAAGLPVASSQASVESKLVQDQVTCLCYQPNNLASIVKAVVTLLTDEPIRQRVAANAQQLIQEEFSLDRMGQAYDTLLRQWVG